MAKEKEGRSSILQTIGATIAGLLAVKLAGYIVTTAWRLVTREEPPQIDEPGPPGKKAMWVALIGAVTGAARQSARDLVIKQPVD